MPNFKKLAKKEEKEALESLKALLRKQSVYDETSIKEGAPYGEGVKSALDYVAKLGGDLGFKVDKCEGYCTELTIGEGNTVVGVYAHSDVVPVSGKWNSNPFEPVIKGEGKEAKLFARGASDDKGPLIAALYAAKLLKDNDLLDGYTIKLVTGGDEERGSSCLEHYFHALKKKPCDYGFTPDAEFPLIYGEKAITGGYFVKNVDLKPIIAFDGGVVRNAVCDKIVITLPADKEFVSFLKETKVDAEVTSLGEVYIVSFKGKSAHGSTPECGVNAAGIAFKVIGTFYKNEFLKKLSEIIVDTNGKSFGGYSLSKELGASSYNYGIFKYDGKRMMMSLDHRYGEEEDAEKAIKALEEASGMTFEKGGSCRSLLFDRKSPLVATLMKAYKRETHRFFDKPMTIGGGTYAKEAPNCVAFGSAFKGREGDIHSPNEFIYLDDFYLQIAIYADAIYSLGHLKK